MRERERENIDNTEKIPHQRVIGVGFSQKSRSLVFGPGHRFDWAATIGGGGSIGGVRFGPGQRRGRSARA
jgi:hypothetical protein